MTFFFLSRFTRILSQAQLAAPERIKPNGSDYFMPVGKDPHSPMIIVVTEK